MAEKSALHIHKLTKIYRDADDVALNEISLDVPKGEIFGLLGPNGAGKTTTINILCGLIRKSSGEVHINGWNLSTDIEKIKRDIGVVPQEIALYPKLSALENLRFIGSMYGLKGRVLKSRIDECLDLMGLSNFAKKQIEAFSGGMKRRVNLIAGILHKPWLLFLDEPTVGIDVQSRNVILSHLLKLKDDGATIIYTSHHMEEAEKLCTQVAILDYGRILISGSPTELIQSKTEYTDLESIFLHLTGRKLRNQ